MPMHTVQRKSLAACLYVSVVFSVAFLLAGCSVQVIDHNPDDRAKRPVAEPAPGETATSASAVQLRGYHDEYGGIRTPTVFPVMDRFHHTGGPARAEFSRDGRFVIVVGGGWSVTTDAWKGKSKHTDDDDIYLWDLSTGQIAQKYKGHTKHVTDIALSFDDAQLLSTSLDGTVRQWDVQSGRLLRRHSGYRASRGNGSNPRTYGVAWSRDGRRAAAWGPNGPARVWDTQTGQRICEIPGAPPPGQAGGLSPDGKLFAYAANDLEDKRIHRLAIYKVDGGEHVRTIAEQKGHGVSPYTHVKFCRDGHSLIAASLAPRWLDVYDLSDGQLQQRIFPPLTSKLSQIADFVLNRDGSAVLIVGERREDGYSLWDLATGDLLGQATPPEGIRVEPFVFDLDPQGENVRLLNGWWYERLALSPPRGMDQRSRQPAWGKNVADGKVIAIAFSPDSRQVAFIIDNNRSYGDAIQLHDVATGHFIARFGCERISVRASLTYSSDGGALFMERTRLTQYDLPEQWPTLPAGETATTIEGRTLDAPDDIRDSSWLYETPSGLLATSRRGTESKGIVFEAHTGRIIHELEKYTTQVLISADGRTCASMLPYKRQPPIVRVRDMPDGSIQRDIPLSDTAELAAITADGSMLLCCRPIQSKLIQIDLTDGRVVREWSDDNNDIHHLLLTPDGRRAVTAGENYTVDVWDLDNGAKIASFNQHRTPITALAVSPDGQWAAAGTRGGTVNVWALPR